MRSRKPLIFALNNSSSSSFFFAAACSTAFFLSSFDAVNAVLMFLLVSVKIV